MIRLQLIDKFTSRWVLGNCLSNRNFTSFSFEQNKNTFNVHSEVSGPKCRLPLPTKHVKLNGKIVKLEERKKTQKSIENKPPTTSQLRSDVIEPKGKIHCFFDERVHVILCQPLMYKAIETWEKVNKSNLIPVFGFDDLLLRHFLTEITKLRFVKVWIRLELEMSFDYNFHEIAVQWQ